MKVQIRFLKQGLVHLDIKENLTTKEMVHKCKEYLNTLPDQELLFAMSDCTPSGTNPSRFDSESFQVDAIENGEFDLIYSTPLWDTYLGINNDR